MKTKHKNDFDIYLSSLADEYIEDELDYKVVNIKWDAQLKKNVCYHCSNPNTLILYLSTGHDHTDGTVFLCNCGEGVSLEDASRDLNLINTLEYYKQIIRDHML